MYFICKQKIEFKELIQWLHNICSYKLGWIDWQFSFLNCFVLRRLKLYSSKCYIKLHSEFMWFFHLLSFNYFLDLCRVIEKGRLPRFGNSSWGLHILNRIKKTHWLLLYILLSSIFFKHIILYTIKPKAVGDL